MSFFQGLQAGNALGNQVNARRAAASQNAFLRDVGNVYAEQGPTAAMNAAARGGDVSLARQYAQMPDQQRIEERRAAERILSIAVAAQQVPAEQRAAWAQSQGIQLPQGIDTSDAGLNDIVRRATDAKTMMDRVDTLQAQRNKDRDYELSERKVSADIRQGDARIDIARQNAATARKNVAAAGAKPSRRGPSGKPTKGQEQVDRTFAKEYVDWRGPKQADLAANLDRLRRAREDLKSKNLTGPLAGFGTAGMRAYYNPESARVQQEIEEVVQRNLRLVLGAQFTQKEGDRLIERAFNPRLQEGANIARIDRLITQIERAAAVREDQARYFEEYGTLQGWEGRLPSAAEIEAFVVQDEQTPPSAPQAAPNRGGGELSAEEQAELEALRRELGE